MTTIKMLASAALLSTSMLVPAAPALAITPAVDANAPTADQMQAICDANYVAPQEDPTVWRASVINAASEATTPTAVAGTERNINYRPDVNGTFTYAGFVKTIDPLSRTGGSPNMWGQMVFSQKVLDNTLYDVEMRFQHNVTYTWTCQVEENVASIVHHPGNNGQCGNTNGNNNGGNLQTGGNGQGNNGCGNGNGGPTSTSTTEGDGTGGSGNSGNNNGENLQTGGNGEGNNGCGNGNGGPTGANENCGGGGNPGWDETVWTWTHRADYGESQLNTDIDDGYDVTATALQQLGHVLGVDYIVPGTYTPDGYRLLSCISPGKKGGSWTAKAWYTGGQCSTTTFNAAPTMYPSHVFAEPPTNSLPAQ
ncbi:hypothetical protein H8M03_08090 [Sphingomonas sabuli]|uniref:Secreted protein n=1 Tax=Sphingomonas sabuli TaxID=2764186 RepID=A0A7G9L045_9SPHN|nr:hypothetical protein [Sphingomonas sabuli]QNM81994.1 hypothetical protein H8M03_08090 [Sphingomonas sabuli]